MFIQVNLACLTKANCHAERSEASLSQKPRPFAEFTLSEANVLRVTFCKVIYVT
jgi:hypothetical protein